MDYLALSKKLNKTAECLGVRKTIKFIHNLNSEKIANLLSESVPFAKVAVFFTKNSYVKSAMPLLESLKKASLKPISIVLNKEARLSTDNVKGLFNINEDVRYLIITDNTLKEVGLYFATVMNIPLLFIVNSYDVKGILSSSLTVDNGKCAQAFTVSAPITVAFDDNQIQNSKIFYAIATVGAKIPTLIDYKIHSALIGEEQDSLLVQTIEDAIDVLLNISDATKSQIEYLALYSALTVELCTFLYGGKLNELSSAVITARLIENATLESANAEFSCAKKIMKRYLTAFSLVQSQKNVSDYKLIAEKLCGRLNKDFALLCSDIFYKTSIIADCGKVVDRLRVLLKNTAIRGQKEIASIDKLYKAFGGKTSYLNKKTDEFLELSGYAQKVINGMTLVSELGL